MTYYVDLSVVPFFGPEQPACTMIGWLSAEHDFVTSDVDPSFFERLVELLHNPWELAVTAGSAKCGFCRFSGGPSNIAFRGKTARVGTSNLLVPSQDKLYFAPSLIAHYIDAHAYSPPVEFHQAVLSCPAMRSMEYLKALRRHGIRRA